MDKQQQTTIERIAKEHLGILCLETRQRDSLDFYDISVWGAKAALEAAYNAGRLHEINLQKKG
jgi:hypothetical protein